MNERTWKPDADEAKFLGQVLNLSPELATIARNMLAKGTPLREVVATYQHAVKMARQLQDPKS